MSDYQYITETGVIIADTSSVLTDVQNEWKTSFGEDLIVTPDTPQGVMITAEALSRDNVINNNAAIANQINPYIAGGVFLDGIMALTGSSRTVATPTVVSGVTVTGVAGTIIPIGSIAKTSNDDEFQTTSAVTIPVGGTTTATFQSVELGAIPCAAGALTTIVSSVLGWETVNNSSAGVLGSSTQTDQQARAYRNNTLAFNGISLAEAITSALYATTGVKSLKFRENVENTTQVIDGITMVAKSVYACVDGGTDTAVAAALLENKSSGSAWNGGTSVAVTEPASGQSYTVKFDRPSEIGVLIEVTTTNGNASSITDSVINYANGDISGFVGFTVGTAVSPFEIAGAIVAENIGTIITSVRVSYLSPVSYTTSTLAIGIDEKAITQSSYVTVINL